MNIEFLRNMKVGDSCIEDLTIEEANELSIILKSFEDESNYYEMITHSFFTGEKKRCYTIFKRKRN